MRAFGSRLGVWGTTVAMVAGVLAVASAGSASASTTCAGKAATIMAVPGGVTNGTPGDDVIVGSGQGDEINGGGGNDTICGMGGADLIDGGPGNDLLLGGGGGDVILGGPGDDVIRGMGGDDVVAGEDGNDKLFGDSGDDELDGGEGDDQLNGGSDEDTLLGGPGNDRLDGNMASDSLFGGPGDDLLIGNGPKAPTADKVLDGGEGNDTIIHEDAQQNPRVAKPVINGKVGKARDYSRKDLGILETDLIVGCTGAPCTILAMGRAVRIACPRVGTFTVTVSTANGATKRFCLVCT